MPWLPGRLPCGHSMGGLTMVGGHIEGELRPVSGRQVHVVHGPEDLSRRRAAEIVTDATGHPLRAAGRRRRDAGDPARFRHGRRVRRSGAGHVDRSAESVAQIDVTEVRADRALGLYRMSSFTGH